MSELPKRLFTVEEAAHYLGYSARTLYNRIGSHAKDPFPIKAIRVGKSVRFDVEDLDQYVERLKVDSQ